MIRTVDDGAVRVVGIRPHMPMSGGRSSGLSAQIPHLDTMPPTGALKAAAIAMRDTDGLGGGKPRSAGALVVWIDTRMDKVA